MKSLIVTAIILFGSLLAHAQNELAPILEKEFEYKNFEFKRVDGNGKVELREFTSGKKLVLVVYFAPWCHNWRYEAPIVQKLYEKYKDKGFDVIGIGEYATVDEMKNDVTAKKLSFTVVYESDSTQAKTKTTHYTYRKSVGDMRNWGSPFNVFLPSANILKEGDTIAKKVFVGNGELIETEADAFVLEKLGLGKDEKKTETVSQKPIEVCDPNAVTLKKP